MVIFDLFRLFLVCCSVAGKKIRKMGNRVKAMKRPELMAASHHHHHGGKNRER